MVGVRVRYGFEPEAEFRLILRDIRCSEECVIRRRGAALKRLREGNAEGALRGGADL